MKVLLVQQVRFNKVFKMPWKVKKDLPKTLSEKKKNDILEKAQRAIILSLGDKALKEVSRETSAAAIWLKLEKLYMTKSLANRLYLKQRLYSFKMAEGKSIED